MTNEFERIVEFYPAYDKRHPEPKKNYGIHGVTIKFVLKKENKAVQFVIYSNWQLPHVTEEFLNKPPDKLGINALWMPMPADLGYHSPFPMYEEHEPITNDCEWIDGPCYYDGSTLNADPVFEILLKEGSKGIWKYLEEYYEERFGNHEGAMK